MCEAVKRDLTRPDRQPEDTEGEIEDGTDRAKSRAKQAAHHQNAKSDATNGHRTQGQLDADLGGRGKEECADEHESAVAEEGALGEERVAERAIGAQLLGGSGRHRSLRTAPTSRARARMAIESPCPRARSTGPRPGLRRRSG